MSLTSDSFQRGCLDHASMSPVLARKLQRKLTWRGWQAWEAAFF